MAYNNYPFSIHKKRVCPLGKKSLILGIVGDATIVIGLIAGPVSLVLGIIATVYAAKSLKLGYSGIAVGGLCTGIMAILQGAFFMIIDLIIIINLGISGAILFLLAGFGWGNFYSIA